VEFGQLTALLPCSNHGHQSCHSWVFSQDLGFFDPILGSGFYHEDLGFFLGIFKSAWVVLGFSKILGNIMFFLCFLPKSKELFIDLVEKWYVVGDNHGEI